MNADVVIAGAGLAGACAALALANRGRVVVLDDGQPGASHAAAGLVNPFMGRKAKRAWRASEALAALAETVDEAGRPDLFRQTGLLRPARDARQADAFRQRAGEFPLALDWLPSEASAARWPDVVAPHGALWVREGGHIEIPALVAALLDTARAHGAEVVPARLVGWTGESLLQAPAPRGGSTQAGRSLRATAKQSHPVERRVTRSPRRSAPRDDTNGSSVGALTLSLSPGKGERDLGAAEVQTRRLLLCTGDGTRALAPSLPLHRVKGQTVRLGRGPGRALPADAAIPPVSGPVYVVPVAPSEVVVGATFEHTFDTLAPTSEATDRLRQRAAAMAPALEGAEVLEARAGVRLTVPERVRPGRLPLVGPLAGSPGVWVLAGLGAKGLLTAPLLARHLPAWWDAPEAIWPEVSTL